MLVRKVLWSFPVLCFTTNVAHYNKINSPWQYFLDICIILFVQHMSALVSKSDTPVKEKHSEKQKDEVEKSKSHGTPDR